MTVKELSYKQLKNYCSDECTQFKTTADLKPLEGIIGQDRATKAIDFGLNIKKKGYNIFVSGISGTGRSSYIQLITNKKAEDKPISRDWVYVYNFKNPDNPLAIDLEAGNGKKFQKAVENTIVFIKKEMENTFTSKEYERKKGMIIKELNQESESIMSELNELAKEYGFTYTNTDRGLISVPLKEDGTPMKEEDFRNMEKDVYEKIQSKSNELNLASIDLFKKLRDIQDEFRDKVKELDTREANKIVKLHIDKIKKAFKNERIRAHLKEVQKDIVENVDMFKSDDNKNNKNPFLAFQKKSSENFFERYQINLFIDNSDKSHAPVVFETNPTYNNLLGNIEYENEMGVLKTNFSKIKPGSLHAANGGYLIMNVRDLLENIYTWKGLMRSLQNDEIKIESMQSMMGYPVTSALKPEAIPLDIKVILIGDPRTYSILYSYDEQFPKLFKIRADFDIEMDRTKDNVMKMQSFIASHCEKENIRHFTREAVCKVVEHSSRIADSQKKLSSRFNQIVEILYEADAWAEQDGSDKIELKHIEKTIQEKIYRNNMYEEKTLEYFEDEIYLLDVEGEKIGEINGLAVVGTGEYSFGKPSKITVSTYRGKSGLINIEREARTSGKIHDKGVMIINGYLGYKYAQEKPLALSASIVFEQQYSGIDGDSASSTELYAIMSSLSGKPIKQSIAVTGSVNQRGMIQPIGGVNQKIEGFYKVCKIKGFNGEQGVIIPKQNVNDLMLKEEVIEAVKEGKFHIYAVETIEEGIEILTGVEAGKKDEKGKYPQGTIHYLVDKKLHEYFKSTKQKNTSKKIKTEDKK
ncbi:MAG: ATP-binding protein [Bacillota bacterium]|nr:ATP-binding protein [Bacillota bacterium]